MDGISTSRLPLDAPVTATLDRPPRESLDGPALPAEERAKRLPGQEWVERYRALPFYLVLFLLVYAPSIMMTYGYADDYNFLYDFSSGNPRPIFLEILFGGRPIEAILMFSMGAIGHVGRLWIMRLIAILGIGALAWLSHRALRSVHCHPMVALCAPIIICTLPPIALYATWSLAAFWPLASILSGLAVLVLERNVLRIPHVPALVVALSLQTMATALYQPPAMVFWVFAAIYLLMEKRTPRDLLRRLLVQCFVVVGALAIDFAFTKALPLLVQYNTPVAGRSTIAHDPIAKAHYFLRALFDALNLWSLAPSSGRAEAMLSFVVVGLLLYFEGPWRQKGIRIAIAGTLLPLAVLPNLLVVENGGAYRFEGALTGLIALYGVVAIVGYARVIKRVFSLSWSTASTWIPVRGVAIVLFLVTAASCLSANKTVNSEIVVPNTLAYQVLQRGIEQANLNRSVAHVYVVHLSCPIDSPSPILSYEYGRASTAIDWAVPQMTYLALRDLYPNLTGIRVLVVAPGQEIAVPAGAAVIDARELGFYTHARTPRQLSALGCLPQG